MTAVESPAGSSTIPATKKTTLGKPERPDEEAFRKAEAVAKRELDDAQKALSEVKNQIDLAKPGNKNPRQQELKVQLAEIRSQVAAKKASRGKIEDQIKTLQDSINARVKELNAKKNNMPYRTVADLGAAIDKLDRDVSSGKMKIVDERKALQEISALTKQKKNFPIFDEQHKTIDADRATLKSMKEQKQDPELKELNDKYDVLDKEMKAIKEEQDSAYEHINSLRDQRTAMQAVKQEKWEAVKKIQDEFYQNRNAYRTYEKEARRLRDERRAEERARLELEKKRAIATERMEAASQPALVFEIQTCESLIAYFDPSSAEAARRAKQAVAPRELAAKATREVKPIDRKPLVKEEVDYFVGGGGKKKKGKKNRGALTDSAESPTTENAPSKFNLNVAILEQLSTIDVPTPSSHEDVPQLLKLLKEKMQYFQDNQERITKENIAKAKKEIERLEKDGEKFPEEKQGSVSPGETAQPVTIDRKSVV